MKRRPVPLSLLLACAWIFFGCSLASQVQTTTSTPGAYSAPAVTTSPNVDSYGAPAVTQEPAAAAETAAVPQTAPVQPAITQPALDQGTTAATQAGASTAPPTAAAAAPGLNLADTTDPTLVSNLVDGEIARSDGAEIAEIDSLVLDRATGGIVYVFLKTDVDLEDADQVVAVPWSALQVTEDTNDALDRITFTLDPSLLVSAPPLVVTDLFNYNDPAWDDPSAAYWSSQASALLPATGADASAAGMLRLKDEDDLRLIDAQGGQVAEVKEVIVDPASGQFRYVLVEPASNLGAVDARLPIPFEKLSWNTPAPDALLLNVDRTVLDAAPSYPSDGALPDTATPGWDAAVQQYWAGH